MVHVYWCNEIPSIGLVLRLNEWSSEIAEGSPKMNKEGTLTFILGAIAYITAITVIQLF